MRCCLASVTHVKGGLQVAELTQGGRLEVEILTVLLQRMQQARQQDGTDGRDCQGQALAVLQLQLPLSHATVLNSCTWSVCL